MVFILKKVKSEGLSHISYFVGSEGEAAVIDPRRDCQAYLQMAFEEEMEIKHVLETHRNEDCVTGAVELQKNTGAQIYHGGRQPFRYGNALSDGQELAFGKMVIKAMETPGHTIESISYALYERGENVTLSKPILVFTGDTLFVGEVGRADLCAPSERLKMAEMIYDSIHGKLLPLGDGVIICPAHGAGSVCGRTISDREESTIGIERDKNPRLKLSRHEFVQLKSTESFEKPPYFKKMEEYNLNGPPLSCNLPLPHPLSPADFKAKIDRGAIVLDVRKPSDFGGAHVPGAYSIWFEGLPYFAGWILPYDKKILLALSSKEQVEGIVRVLGRLGYDQFVGYLAGNLEAWYTRGYPTSRVNLISVQDLRERLGRKERLVLLDVREEQEFREGHIKGAIHNHLASLEERIDSYDKAIPTAVICNSGNRSSIAASVLLRNGFKEVYNVLGSITAWKNAGYPTEK